ncbi:NAD(P)/FAD-dependent oxidoreductase [Candidatus Nomurabacteria bacterium]|nr:NAD(P)/FAD-dependent oxidoreductase [Candidatus Nomurabacteria bacterium]
MSIPKIVIVGGGFGGAYTARYLRRFANSGQVEVTLINRNNYFLFTPLLHEVATGGLSEHSVIEPIREIFHRSHVRFVQAEVKKIDPKKKSVLTSAGKISYDYLVLSTGAETNYYDTPGAEKYSYTLKNLSDAVTLRKQIINNYESGKTKFVVIGGGATGVELAAELIEFLRDTLLRYQEAARLGEETSVTLVCASEELIPQFPLELRRIAHETLSKKGVTIKANSRVTEVHKSGIKLADGSNIESETVIWVAGVRPSASILPSPDNKPPNDRLKIDEYLRVLDEDNIFALGDNSGTFPMLAQVAVQEAHTVAKNLMATIKGRPLRPFHYKERGLLISLGQWSAAGRLFGGVYHGRLMWWLWRTIYLFNFLSWRKRFRIAAEWTINLFSRRDISSF